MATRQIKESKFNEFKQIRGSTGAVLYVLGKNADYSNSMDLLDMAGLRPLKYREILTLLMNDELLKKQLKEKWIYLSGKGVNKKSGLHTINKKGKLTKNKENASFEKNVYIWPGPNPPSLYIESNEYGLERGRRFFLNATSMPHYMAQMVVGVPKYDHIHKSNHTKAQCRKIQLHRQEDLAGSNTPKLENAKKNTIDTRKVKALIRNDKTTASR
jgi:hypothetical protein